MFVFLFYFIYFINLFLYLRITVNSVMHTRRYCIVVDALQIVCYDYD